MQYFVSSFILHQLWTANNAAAGLFCFALSLTLLAQKLVHFMSANIFKRDAEIRNVHSFLDFNFPVALSDQN